jgi:uncharacterized membrane protein YfcA
MGDIALLLLATVAAFTVSSAAGLGGSLILVPAYAFVLGTKEGVALAALLLAVNNVVKMVAYRRTIPWRASAWVVLATIVGAFVGARLLVYAPEHLVTWAVLVTLVASLLLEAASLPSIRRASAPVLALMSGLVSGFSGTSGPLKGVALRALALDRMHLVGAASVVSFVGDATKTSVYAEAGLLTADSWRVGAFAIPLMILATALGRRLNRSLGERGYAAVFWVVIGGYGVRLVAGL